MLLTRLALILAVAGLGLASAWQPASAQRALRNAGPSGLGSVGRAGDDAGEAAADALRRAPTPPAPPLAPRPPGPSAVLGKLPPPPAPAAQPLPPLPPPPAAYDRVPTVTKVVYGALPGAPGAGAVRRSPELVGGFVNRRPGALLNGVPLPVKVDPAALRQASSAPRLAGVIGSGAPRVPLPRGRPVDVPVGPAGRLAAVSPAAAPSAVKAVRRIDASTPQQLSPLGRQAQAFEPLGALRLPDPPGPPSRYPKAGKRVLYGIMATSTLSSIGISVATQVGDATSVDPEPQP